MRSQDSFQFIRSLLKSRVSLAKRRSLDTPLTILVACLLLGVLARIPGRLPVTNGIP